MKKILLILALAFGYCSTDAQVTKSEVEKMLQLFPFSGFEKIYIVNDRVHYNDGSNRIEETYYTAKNCNIELNDHGIFVHKFKDATKAEQINIAFYPYESMDIISVSSKSMSIKLKR